MSDKRPQMLANVYEKNVEIEQHPHHQRGFAGGAARIRARLRHQRNSDRPTHGRQSPRCDRQGNGMKKRRKYPLMRFRKNDPAHNLLVAAQHWLQANGGDALVIGGIGVLRQQKNRFYVTVNCVGTWPPRNESRSDELN